MNLETERSTSERTVRAVPVLAVILSVLACPVQDAAAASLHADDIPRVLNTAVSYFYQSKVRRRTTDAACYFDPNVKNSMACTWKSYDSGTDSYHARQEVKKKVLKWCKESGGKSCVRFYRNGKLRYDGLPPHMTRKFETILSRIPSYLTETAPFPEGARINGRFREWFERERKYREETRTKRHGSRGRRVSYAICGNERGIGMTFSMEGTRPSMRHVRRECVMSCQVYAEWHSVKDPCYVIYEDGRFSSAAAQRAVLRK